MVGHSGLKCRGEGSKSRNSMVKEKKRGVNRRTQNKMKEGVSPGESLVATYLTVGRKGPLTACSLSLLSTQIVEAASRFYGSAILDSFGFVLLSRGTSGSYVM